MRQTQCPSCAAKGGDSRKDNLIHYKDGGAYCFACGYREKGKFNPEFKRNEKVRTEKQINLPDDFTRSLTPECHRWLAQWGLSPRYWQEHCGYSEEEHRLIFTYGEPIRYAQGRALRSGEVKWTSYGDRPSEYETLGKQLSGKVVLVEDIISAHKVAQVAKALPLFGTSLYPGIVRCLLEENLPVVIWLDADRWAQNLSKLVNSLQVQGIMCTLVHSSQDPKAYSVPQIEEILNDLH